MITIIKLSLHDIIPQHYQFLVVFEIIIIKWDLVPILQMMHLPLQQHEKLHVFNKAQTLIFAVFLMEIVVIFKEVFDIRMDFLRIELFIGDE